MRLKKYSSHSVTFRENTPTLEDLFTDDFANLTETFAMTFNPLHKLPMSLRTNHNTPPSPSPPKRKRFYHKI